jgi:dimethylaniline monooxygenase (N-oxide forming)
MSSLKPLPAMPKFLSWMPLFVHYIVMTAPIALVVGVRKALGRKGAALYMLGVLRYLYWTIFYPGRRSDIGPGTSVAPAPSSNKKNKKRIIVIGAGPAGVVTSKELIAQGHDVTCFDSEPQLGGEFANGFWPGGHLTSSPYITAFSDFPPKRPWKNAPYGHWSKEEYVQYLQDYCDHFGVTPSIHLGTNVMHVELCETKIKEGDVEKRPAIFVKVRGANGTVRDEGPFDHIGICCGGLSEIPVIIEYPGLSSFSGNVVHSKQLAPFESVDSAFQFGAGKRIVTVGLGESMSDILGLMNACQNPPKHCYASARAGAFVIPRINPLNSIVNDFDSTRLRYALPKIVHNATIVVCSYLANIFEKEDDPHRRTRFELFRQLPGLQPASTRACKSDKFVSSVVRPRW